MWFLIKGTFWFSMVLVALSYFGTSDSSTTATSQMNITGAVSAANEAYRYVSAICVEKPDVCVKGVETFHALGERARDGARVAYDLIDAQLAASEDPTKAAPHVADAAPVVSVEFPQNSDDIKTGTINTGNIPLPQKRPAL